RRDPGAFMLREAAHMHFVDDGADRRRAERHVSFPIVGPWVHDHALHGLPDVRAGARGRLPAVSARGQNEQTVGVDEDLFGIETEASTGKKWTVGAVPIDLASADALHECVVVVIRAMPVRSERD